MQYSSAAAATGRIVLQQKSFIASPLVIESSQHILHEFLERIIIHVATNLHSKINRKQEMDIYYKSIKILGILEAFESRKMKETA